MATQQWAVDADGGFLANPPLSKKLRKAAQPMMKFRQFVRVEEGFGKGRGDTLDFDKVSNVQTQGGAISESAKMPETKYQIVKDSLVMTEYGNSVPFTGKLEALSEFDISNPTQKTIRDDMVKMFDIEVAAEFKRTRTMYTPTGEASGSWDTDGTISNTATTELNLFHLKEIVDGLATGDFGTQGTNDFNPVPPFTGPDGEYIMIISRQGARGIKDDPEFEEWMKYTQPERLIRGEIGRVYNTRVIETNHNAALDGNKVAGTFGEAIIFGDDPVIEGVAVPEELRAKIPQDFGRDKALGWYFLGGWKLAWRTSTTPSADDIRESHVIFVTDNT